MTSEFPNPDLCTRPVCWKFGAHDISLRYGFSLERATEDREAHWSCHLHLTCDGQRVPFEALGYAFSFYDRCMETGDLFSEGFRAEVDECLRRHLMPCQAR